MDLIKVTNFPSFTRSGARGRKLLGLDDNPVWVEGKQDVDFYSRIFHGRKFSVGDGKKEVIIIGSKPPYPDCIVDHDFDNFLDVKPRQRENIFTTKYLNDLESIWIYILNNDNFLESNFGIEVTKRAYGNSSLVGKLRIISHQKSDYGKNKSWRMIFKDNIELTKMLQSDSWRQPLDYLINHNSKKMKSKEQWLRKIRVLNKDLPPEKLHFVCGKDLILYLYLELNRNHSRHDFINFNRKLLIEAAKKINNNPNIIEDFEFSKLIYSR
tara:strand:+ start:102 stop:905 length:804 start_codon:yes stop_codon:yes gene_type:complete